MDAKRPLLNGVNGTLLPCLQCSYAAPLHLTALLPCRIRGASVAFYHPLHAGHSLWRAGSTACALLSIATGIRAVRE